MIFLVEGVRLETIVHQKAHPQQMAPAVENTRKLNTINGVLVGAVFLSFIGTCKLCSLFMVDGVSGVSGVDVLIHVA